MGYRIGEPAVNAVFQRWLKLSIVPRIAAPLLRMIACSWRVENIGLASLAEIGEERRIVTVWHGRLLITACILRFHNIHVMVSDHDDGELITRIVERMGFTAIRGSSTRGGVKAALGSVDAIRDGKIGGMLPDGPTGPRHKAKLGTVWLAREAGAVIVPVSGSCDRGWQFFKSWDRFLVPKPFAKVAFNIGDVLKVEGDGGDAIKHANRLLESTLNRLERECDEHFGRPLDPTVTDA